MSFSSDLRTFAESVLHLGRKQLQNGIIRIGGKLVEYSPIDTGRYVSNHRVGINEIDETVKMEGFRLPGGRVTGGVRGPGARGNPLTKTMEDRLRRRFASAARRAKPGDTIYFTNGVPYAERLENGHSSQAPNGVYSRVFGYFDSLGDGGVGAEKEI